MSVENKDNVLASLEPLLHDPDIFEIMVDGPERVYVEKKGELLDVPSPFRDEAHLLAVIDAILSPLGLVANESRPIVDARLADGSYVNVVMPPISLVGPSLVLRRMSKDDYNWDDLVGFGTLSKDMMTFIRACVESKLNIVVAGGANSGKTTVFRLVAGMIPNNERIIVVQNQEDFRLTQKYVVVLESRPPNLEGKGEVTIRELLTNAMRMRPDRIVLGEVQSAEVLDFLQAVNTGYEGVMTNIHANSPQDVLARLELMASYANLSISLVSLRQMIASGIDLITYQEHLSDGSRKITKISEIVGLQGDNIEIEDIFEFRRTGTEDGKIKGYSTATGTIPKCLEKIKAAGIDLPLGLFTPR